MYKFTDSVDNRLRTTISLKIRVSLEDIATFVTVQESFDLWTYGEGEKKVIHEPGLIEVTKSKGRVMKIVMDCIRNRGTEAPHYNITDDGLDDVRDAVLERIKELWKEPSL